MAVDYVSEIQGKDTLDLVGMLQKIANGKRVRRWASGKALEHLILRAFKLEGAEVVWPYTVPYEGRIIEQIDGAIYCDGLNCLVEAKDYSDPLGIEPIAKLRSQLARRPSGVLGLVFGRSDFSLPAKTLTRMVNPLNVLLWEFEELEMAVTNQSMRQALKTKFRYAVEHGMPDYNIKAGLR